MNHLVFGRWLGRQWARTRAVLWSILPGVAFIVIALAILFGPGWLWMRSSRERDFIKEGVNQETLRSMASSFLGEAVPDDVVILSAEKSRGRDPSNWFVISSARPLDELVRKLESAGFVESTFAVSRPPRDYSETLKPLIDFAAFTDARSLMKVESVDPLNSGVWVLIDRRRQAIVICDYSM